MTIMNRALMISTLRTSLIMAAAALTAACSSENYEPRPDRDGGYLDVYATTRSGEPAADRTYCMLLFYGSTEEYTGRTGFYHQNAVVHSTVSDKTWFEPCSVNADGSFLERDCDEALHYVPDGDNMQEDVYLCAVSPAFAPVCYDPTAGTYGRLGYGYKQSRVRQSDEVQYISAPKKMSFSNIYLDNRYVYDASDMTMTEYRSHLNVRIRCGKDIGSVKVRGLQLNNTITVAYYNFFKGFQKAEYGDDPIWTPAVPQTFYAGDGTEGEYALVVEDVDIFSQDYGKTDEHGELVNEIPYLYVMIGDDSTGDDSTGPVVKIPFSFDMKPHYQYTVSLTINSIYVHAEIDADPWNEIVDIPSAVGEDWSRRIYVLDEPILSWEKKIIDPTPIDN